MSKTKGGGSTRNGRDSNAQRLGVKVFGGTQDHTPARSSSASAAPASTPARTSASAATTRCSRSIDGAVKFGQRGGRKVVDVEPLVEAVGLGLIVVGAAVQHRCGHHAADRTEQVALPGDRRAGGSRPHSTPP